MAAPPTRSLSGPIRRVIGPVNSRLVTAIGHGNAVLHDRPAIDTAPRVVLRSWVATAKRQLIKLTRNEEQLTKQNEQWLTLIYGLPAAERAAEQDIYDCVAIGSEGEPGFLQHLDQSSEVSQELEGLIAQTSELINDTTVLLDEHSTSRSWPDGGAATRRPALPKIELVRFSGERRDWWGFWTSFCAIVDDNNELRPYEKLHYLKVSLHEGSAERYLAGLSLIDGNYDNAKRILLRQFGDDREMVRDLHQTLAALKPAQRSGDVRDLQLTLEATCLQLHSLGFSTDEDQRLLDEIQCKLPASTLTRLHDSKVKFHAAEPHGAWNMRRFRAALEELVRLDEAIRRTTNTRTADPRDKPPDKAKPPWWRRQTTAVTGHAHEAGEGSDGEVSEDEEEEVCQTRVGRVTPRCIFCGTSDDHWSTWCRKHPTTLQRKRELRKQERCWKCYGKGHTAANCSVKLRCQQCGGDDHKKPMCPHLKWEQGLDTNPPTKTAAAVQEKTTRSDEDADSNTDGEGVQSVQFGGDRTQTGTVVMMCAKVHMSDPEAVGGRRIQLVAFMDSGSTASFITNEAAKRLGLRFGKPLTLSVDRFNQDEPGKMTAHRVCPNLVTQTGGVVPLSLYTTNRITRQVRTMCVNESDVHELRAGKKDVVVEQVMPDVLLGSDHLEDTIQLRWKGQLPSGFSMYSSTVGPLLGGKGRAIVPSGVALTVNVLPLHVKEGSDETTRHEKHNRNHSSPRRQDSHRGRLDGLHERRDRRPSPPAKYQVDPRDARPLNVRLSQPTMLRAKERKRGGIGVDSAGKRQIQRALDAVQAPAIVPDGEEAAHESGTLSGWEDTTAKGGDIDPNTLYPDGLELIDEWTETGEEQEEATPRPPLVVNSNTKPDGPRMDDARSMKKGKKIRASSAAPMTFCMLAIGLSVLPATTAWANAHWERRLQEYFTLEGLGINDDAWTDADADAEAERLVKASIRREPDGRYEVGLPWAYPQRTPHQNRELAMQRLASLLRQLRGDEQRRNAYHAWFQTQLKDGILEVVEEDQTDGPIVHYLPHFGVGKKDGSVRVVFAANSKRRSGDLSLNDCLLKGPTILENLVGVLIRSRTRAALACADIQGAFLQVGVRTEDRDALRALWVHDPTQPPSPENLLVVRFRRVMFGAAPSPSLLGLVLQHHLTQTNNKVLGEELQRNLYVDNIALLGDDNQDLQEKVEATAAIFRDAQMHLREWISNRPEALKNIPTHSQLPLRTTKLLGVPWNPDTDEWELALPQPSGEDPATLTKRLAMSGLAKALGRDPLGLMAPALLRSKLIMQELCREKWSWDTPLSTSITEKWNESLKDWQGSPLRLPRYTGTPTALHGFADASGKALGASLYLVGDRGAHLVYARSRVRPSNWKEGVQFTPRLELAAVELATHAAQFVRRQLDLPNLPTRVWTDSEVVLSWLNSASRKEIFVEKRIASIKRSRDIEVRFVPGRENPADLCSRGKAARDLGEFWQHGPEWLAHPDRWPGGRTQPPYLPEAKNEESSVVATRTEETSPSPLMTYERVGRWDKLVRIVAYARRFIHNTRSRASKGLSQRGALTIDEMEGARTRVLADVQNIYNVTDETQLPPFQGEDGLWRGTTRLEHAHIPPGTKAPILLPRRAWVTALIILDLHTRLLHCGVSTALTAFRQTFWTSRPRRTIERTIRDLCYACRRWNCKPYTSRPSPPLPGSRVSDDPPYAHVGLDYWGPVQVKLESGRGSEERKVWVAIFTCLSTRLTNMEVVLDYSARSFLLALRRHCARNGVPTSILSDNGSNLLLGKRVLDEETKIAALFPSNDEVLSFCSHRAIRWLTTIERAPWKGGCYERIIGIVKRALRHTIKKTRLPIDVLQTLLAECCAVVNSRPLTYVPSDASEYNVLRPMDFQHPHIRYRHIGGPGEPCQLWSHAPSAEELMLMWEGLNSRADAFWEAWRAEYLPSLIDRTCRRPGHPQHNSTPRLGDVVILNEESPRGNWPLAVVTRLIASKDGEVRAAEVRLGTTRRTMRRAIEHLYPLELPPMELPPETVSAEAPRRRYDLRPRAEHHGPTRTTNLLLLIFETMLITKGAGAAVLGPSPVSEAAGYQAGPEPIPLVPALLLAAMLLILLGRALGLTTSDGESTASSSFGDSDDTGDSQQSWETLYTPPESLSDGEEYVHFDGWDSPNPSTEEDQGWATGAADDYFVAEREFDERSTASASGLTRKDVQAKPRDKESAESYGKRNNKQ